MNILATYNPSNIGKEIINTYKIRNAVRGVVLDGECRVAVLYKNEIYYALPGGGVNEGEDFESAFVREHKEEVGGSVHSLKEVGATVEYLSDRGVKNITHIFIGKVGEKGEPAVVGDEDEAELACRVKWVSLEELKETLKKMIEVTPEEKRFRLERDLLILEQK